MNELLAGSAGSVLVCVDARGYRFAEFSRRDGGVGQDVLLSVDKRIQQLAEDALGGAPGAVVVLDPRNGDVLALASSPAFDPNAFVPAVSAAEWERLTTDVRKPLLNRAVGGVYPPGSLMKPIVAAAALESGTATPATQFSCPGYFSIGSARLRCWNPNGHGELDLHGAIEQSCNSYFAALGLKTGCEAIARMARAAGLGRRTGVALEGEAEGLVPDAAWKRARYREGWRDGDTCNVSVGQGPISVTPLQMAVFVAAIANGGAIYRPRLVLGLRPAGAKEFTPLPPQKVGELGWSEPTLRAIRTAMRGVIESPAGTGGQAKVAGVEMAGKTGTAEYGPKSADTQHGWMMVFAPYDAPRYAAAMVLDDAVSGGKTVAPRIRLLMEGIFGVEREGG